MTDTWRFMVVMLLVITLATLLPLVAEAQSGRTAPVRQGHNGDCSKMTGIAQARCERHERRYEKCHAIRGESHHECDRQFIVANPLDCRTLSAEDARACEHEREAVRACSAVSGRGFFRCVSGLLRADPRH